MQPALLQQLQAGLEAHRRGDLVAAEQGYRAVLAQAPEALDAYNLLGRLLVQVGRAPEALPLLRHALDIGSGREGLWLSYAEALLAAGQTGAAREAAETARQLAPRDADIMFIWSETQRLAGAWQAAAGGFRQVLALQPGHAGAALQLGTCLQAMGDPDGALQAAEQALTLAPQAPECHNNLGSLLTARGDYEAAIRSFDRALQLRPGYPAALINKAGALRETGRQEEALPLAEAAVQASHGHADAWSALAQVRHAMGRLEEARAGYREALARRPEDAETQWNYALAALALGDFATGWPAYNWRWRKTERPLPHRNWPWPLRRPGEDAKGKHLLVWGEQGLGDRLLFLQYLPDLLAAGARITLETDERLVPLLRRTFPEITFVAERAPPANELLQAGFDAHVPLGDLGQAAPPGRSILSADAGRAAGLRQQYLAGRTDRLIGLSWRSANATVGTGKSVPVDALGQLAGIAGCRFVCLQYGASEAEHATLRNLFGDRYIHDPGIDARMDLDGLAAQISALDLTVTVSNVTAHLAGALGCPVWVLAPAGKSLFFYLMGEGETTPWYASMRIFRRRTTEDWLPVLTGIAKGLESLAKPAGR